MAFEHPSGLPKAYDRSASDPARALMVWAEGVFVQGADLNELQSLEARRNRRVGDMTAKDGDRITGADIVLDTDTAIAAMSAGEIYIKGDRRPVAAANLTAVTLVGQIRIGVKLQSTLITGEDDATLYGLEPGTTAEGEPGAARVREVLVWAKEGDVQAGDFYPVYTILDGTVIDQAPPPILTGVAGQIGIYDYDANRNYVVDGCEVTALGRIVADQAFSIAAGTANIRGFKRIRQTALRFTQTEDPDLEAIAAEVHNYDAATGSPNTVTVDRPPIASVASVIVVKRATAEAVTRGLVPNSSDPLANGSVVAIESVVQGATTYTPTTDYILSSGNVSWGPGGIEPAGGTSYNVTYLYNAAATPSGVTDTTLSVTGGVHDRPILVSYSSKLPRIDSVCLDAFGLPAYIKGISGRRNITRPVTPTTLLRLADVNNTWMDKPTITNDATHNFPYDLQNRLFTRLLDLFDYVDRLAVSQRALEADPIAKKGIFTDAFADDRYRDPGVAQTGAVYENVFTLAVDQVLLVRVGTDVESLPYDEEIVLSQLLATSGRLINPYANFVQMPAGLKLEPPTDFWTEQTSVWTSPLTQEFTAAPGKAPGSSSFDTTISQRQEEAKFLREITVNFTVEGFGVGEELESLTIADIDVTPAGPLVANGSGVITGSFDIPANVPAGTALVRGDGAAGSYCEALFVGQGTIDVAVMQKVTLVTRAAPVPVVVTQAQQQSNPWNMRTSGGHDPLAQSFALVEGRAIIGIDVKFHAVGSPSKGVRVQLAGMDYGLPSADVMAEAFINMTGVDAGDIVEARFDAPVFLPADRQFCFVFLTDDNVHELSIARLGDVDDTQTFVASQPYAVGTLFSSSNRVTWTPEQDADLWFRIVAAKYTSTSRTVSLWTGAFTSVSDILLRATVDLPTQDASVRYELVRADTSVIKLTPGQEYQFAEYITETVSLRAILGGTEKVAATLYPGTTLIGGQVRTSGTYISDAFTMGTGVDVTATFAAFLPSPSTVAVDFDKTDLTWVAATLITAPDLGSGWVEPKYKKTSFTTPLGRVRLTITGSAAARPRLAQLRSYAI